MPSDRTVKAVGAAPASAVIEVRVAELRQLFNSIDPSPFRERDLDPRAETFIVDWARELPRTAPLALRVHLEQAGPDDEAAMLADAVHEYFAQRASDSRRRLRELFHRGRISLAIALVFLGAAMAVSDVLAGLTGSRFAAVVSEGLIIGGWVAMWRPLEVFLYDWWPVSADVRLFERLSRMPVDIDRTKTADVRRSAWPAVPASRRPAHPE